MLASGSRVVLLSCFPWEVRTQSGGKDAIGCLVGRDERHAGDRFGEADTLVEMVEAAVALDRDPAAR